jgi:hypothetical protein
MVKFIHYTGARHAGTIRQLGLRMNMGRFGKGVYCMPIMNQLYTQNKVHPENEDNVDSSKYTWKWLHSQKWRHGDRKYHRHGRKQGLACIFEVPDGSYPLDLFMLMWTPLPKKIDQALKELTHAKQIEFVKDPDYPISWDRSDLFRIEFKVHKNIGITKLLNAYWSEYGIQPGQEHVEVIIRSHIKPDLICSLEGHFKTNKKYKRQKGLGRGRVNVNAYDMD